MANELTLTAVLEFVKGSRDVKPPPTVQKQFDITGTDYVFRSQAIGTSEETLNKGDITNVGYIYARNLDATNSIYLYGTTAAAAADRLCLLKAGDVALFRLGAAGTGSIYAIASAGTPELEYTIIEE